jgi:hypothetical protein
MRRFHPFDFRQRDRVETFHEARMTGIAEKRIHLYLHDGAFFEIGIGFDAHAAFAIVQHFAVIDISVYRRRKVAADGRCVYAMAFNVSFFHQMFSSWATGF